jgi:hypothetical protein
MANFVNTNVYFAELNEDGEKELQKILSRVREPRENSDQRCFGDIFVDGKDGSPSYEETETIAFMHDAVGPKWCYFEDIEDNSFRTVSAWSWPQEGLEWIFEKLSDVDPNFIAVVTYEDESPNFIGASVYTAEGLYDDYEESYEELVAIMLERFEELNEHWDEEEEEFTEEGNDIFYENLYEVISELQLEFTQECIAEIRENRNADEDYEVVFE